MYTSGNYLCPSPSTARPFASRPHPSLPTASCCSSSVCVRLPGLASSATHLLVLRHSGLVSRFCRRCQQDERRVYFTVSQASRQPSYEYYSQRFHNDRHLLSPNHPHDQQRSPGSPRRSSLSNTRRRSVSFLLPASQGANYHHTENYKLQFLRAKENCNGFLKFP